MSSRPGSSPSPTGAAAPRGRTTPPRAGELIEELALEPRGDEPEPAERGGKLSIRQYLRDRERPFLVRDEESREPPRLALRVVVDHSTSMNHRRSGRTRMESVAEGSMMLHLACTALGLDHQVAVTPQQVRPLRL